MLLKGFRVYLVNCWNSFFGCLTGPLVRDRQVRLSEKDFSWRAGRKRWLAERGCFVGLRPVQRHPTAERQNGTQSQRSISLSLSTFIYFYFFIVPRLSHLRVSLGRRRRRRRRRRRPRCSAIIPFFRFENYAIGRSIVEASIGKV